MPAHCQEQAARAQRLKNYEKSFKGQSRQEIANLYDEWAAATYDQDIEAVDHRGRQIISEALRRASSGEAASARVLDVASGTGLLAEALWQEGYRQMDALDGSRVMLEKAKPKNVYQHYFCNFMEETDGVIADCTYDIVVTLGSIGHGHLEAESLRQMFRVTKPGGLICICGVKDRWDGNPEYHQRMRGVINELEKNNRIQILEDRTVENYYYFKQWDDGILILLKRL